MHFTPNVHAGLRSPITSHVLDTTLGKPAAGLQIELWKKAPESRCAPTFVYHRTSNHWIGNGEKTGVYKGTRRSRRSVSGPNEILKARLRLSGYCISSLVFVDLLGNRLRDRKSTCVDPILAEFNNYKPYVKNQECCCWLASSYVHVLTSETSSLCVRKSMRPHGLIRCLVIYRTIIYWYPSSSWSCQCPCGC